MSVNAAVRTEHPHVERRPGVCGGSAVIQGTRIPCDHRDEIDRELAEYDARPETLFP